MKSLFILFTLLTVGTCFSQNSRSQKVLLDTSLIRSIELVKVSFSEPVKSEKKQLDRRFYNDFVMRWNSAKPLGADKYKMTYYVYVTLKDNSKRQFTVNDTKIQENDWMTYELATKMYLDKLWKDSR